MFSSQPPFLFDDSECIGLVDTVFVFDLFLEVKRHRRISSFSFPTRSIQGHCEAPISTKMLCCV